MSKTLYRFFEYLYIIMAIVSIYVAITNWQVDRNRSYLFILFAIVAIGMFFFKRKFRKKIEESNNK